MTAAGASDWRRALALPAVLVIAAELWLRLAGGASESLAPPSAALGALGRALLDGTMLVATQQTLTAAFAGLALGAGLGLAVGLAFGLIPPLDRLMEVVVEAIRPIPSIALLPIALMVFGFGYAMELAIIAKTCFFTMLILTRAAVRGVEPRLLEVARALRLGTLARLTKVVIPAALPRIFVAFRLAASAALIVGVTIEITMNPQGLGFAMMTAQQALRPDLMLAYLLWIGLVGFMLNAALLAAQRRYFGRAALVGEGA